MKFYFFLDFRFGGNDTRLAYRFRGSGTGIPLIRRRRSHRRPLPRRAVAICFLRL